MMPWFFFSLRLYMAFISYKAEELGFFWYENEGMISHWFIFLLKSEYLEDLSILEHRDPLPSAKLPREAFKNTADSSPFSLLIAPWIRESKTNTHAHALGRGLFPENIHKMTFKGSENERSRPSHLPEVAFLFWQGHGCLDHFSLKMPLLCSTLGLSPTSSPSLAKVKEPGAEWPVLGW